MSDKTTALDAKDKRIAEIKELLCTADLFLLTDDYDGYIAFSDIIHKATEGKQ